MNSISFRIARIIKVQELDDAKHPQNIPVGYSTEGIMLQFPVVGKLFRVGTFSTGVIQDVLGDTFNTLNSIYRYEVTGDATIIIRYDDNRAGNRKHEVLKALKELFHLSKHE